MATIPRSSIDDPLLILTFAALLTEAARWGVTTTGRDRDAILADLNRTSGLCYAVNGNAPVSRTAQAYVSNSAA
jgi:hypothetical protein